MRQPSSYIKLRLNLFPLGTDCCGLLLVQLRRTRRRMRSRSNIESCIRFEDVRDDVRVIALFDEKLNDELVSKIYFT